MKLRKIIKSNARNALRGHRGTAVSLLLVALGVSLIINMADAAAMRLFGYEFTMNSFEVFEYSNDFFYNLPAIIVTTVTIMVHLALAVPLCYGIINWYLELTDRREHGVMHIFWPYETKAALRGVMLSVNIVVKLYLVTMVLLIAPLLIAFAGDAPELNDALAMTLVYSGMLLIVVAMVLVWVFAQRFFIAGILLGEKYQLTTHEAIKQSVRYTKGHRWELVRFELSFLPWMLPLLGVGGMLLFSILFDHYSAMPLAWMWLFGIVALATYLLLTPYYTMSHVVYARYLYEYGLSQSQPHTEPAEETAKQEEPQEPQQTVEIQDPNEQTEPQEPSEM